MLFSLLRLEFFLQNPLARCAVPILVFGHGVYPICLVRLIIARNG